MCPILRTHRGELSEDSVERLSRNPLRILDSKDPRDRPIADAAPGIDDYLSSEAGQFFETVTKGLDAAGVAWTRNARLVRGLDYYRHTAFEFVTDRLGAQGTVLGGGRYDGLIETLGGPATPAVGWAAGIERLAMLIAQPPVDPAIAIIPDKPDLDDEASSLAHRLRREGFSVTIAYRGNAKRRVELARKHQADAALFIREPAVSGGTRYHLTLLKTDPDNEFINSVMDAIGPGVGGLNVERRS